MLYLGMLRECWNKSYLFNPPDHDPQSPSAILPAALLTVLGDLKPCPLLSPLFPTGAIVFHVTEKWKPPDQMPSSASSSSSTFILVYTTPLPVLLLWFTLWISSPLTSSENASPPAPSPRPIDLLPSTAKLPGRMVRVFSPPSFLTLNSVPTPQNL